MSVPSVPSAPPKPPLHLRVSITGHRTGLAPGVQESLRAALGMLNETFDNIALENEGLFAPALNEGGANGTLTLISGLAEGTDQLAAEVFLDATFAIKAKKRFEAVLAFEEQAFATTMPAEAAEKLHRLRGRADAVLELAERAPKIVTPPVGLEQQPERRWQDQRYALVADILVRQGDVLIAVWDGFEKIDTGGTSSCVAQALREGIMVVWIDSRSAKINVLPSIRHGDRLTRARQGALAGRDAIARIDRYLRELLLPPAAVTRLGDEAKGRFAGLHDPREGMERFFGLEGRQPELCPNYTWAFPYSWMVSITGAKVKATESGPLRLRRAWPSIPVFELLPATDWVRRELRDLSKSRFASPAPAQASAVALRDIWGAADAAATRLSHFYRSAYVLTYVLGALAVALGLSGLIFSESKSQLMLLELAALVAATVCFGVAWGRSVHNRFLNARDLAEQIRPSWVVAQLGLGGRRILDRDATWTAWAAQAWASSVGLPAFKASPAGLRDIALAVNKAVVVPQRGYHRDNSLKLSLLNKSLEAMGNSALGLAIVVLSVFLASLHLGWIEKGSHAPYWVTALTAGLPALAAACAGLRFQGDFDRFAERSAVTQRELGELKVALENFADRANGQPLASDGVLVLELRDILLDLENVLMSDLSDWRFVYRARPNEP